MGNRRMNPLKTTTAATMDKPLLSHEIIKIYGSKLLWIPFVLAPFNLLVAYLKMIPQIPTSWVGLRLFVVTAL